MSTLPTHQHTAYATSEGHAWFACVAPRECSGAAHGGDLIIEECDCGATRSTERNGRHVTTGPWVACVPGHHSPRADRAMLDSWDRERAAEREREIDGE